jgi:hypothetical protein
MNPTNSEPLPTPPGDSREQREAETIMVALLADRLRVPLGPRRIYLGEGRRVEIDGSHAGWADTTGRRMSRKARATRCALRVRRRSGSGRGQCQRSSGALGRPPWWVWRGRLDQYSRSPLRQPPGRVVGSVLGVRLAARRAVSCPASRGAWRVGCGTILERSGGAQRQVATTWQHRSAHKVGQ